MVEERMGTRGRRREEERWQEEKEKDTK